MPTMPKVALDKLSGFDREVAEAITFKGRLRASKPTIAYELSTDEYGIGRRRPTSPTGEYAYVWRMVALCASPHPKHHCMPVMAFCDLPRDGYKEQRVLEDELKPVIDRILDAMDPREMHGVRRWGQANGLTGTPRYNDEGAVIYR